MQDCKERAGLDLPNWEIYDQAAVLKLDKRMRNFTKTKIGKIRNEWFGWHAFFIYDKANYYGNFKQHIIRRALLRVWDQIRYKN